MVCLTHRDFCTPHAIKMTRQEAQIQKPKGRDEESSKRFGIHAGRSQQLGWSQYWHIEIISKSSAGTSSQSVTSSWRWPRAFNAESSTKIGCSPEHATDDKFENSTGSTQFMCSNDFFANKNHSSNSHSSWLWRTQQERSPKKCLQMSWTDRI